MASNEPVIGIDLGTTNSVVAAVIDGQPVVIKSRTGQTLTPSVIAVAKGDKRLVGHIAKRQAITNPSETVYAAKRLIGRKFSSAQVQEAKKLLAYEIVPGEHDDIRIRLGGNATSLPEISAMVLAELKMDAEQHFGRSVSKAIITVPAYFNDGQRQATKDAGRIAGLDVLRILNEPTAASLAYGFGKNVQGKVVVFDLGGGTFDITVLEISGDVFDVVATGGDTYLGGEDWDHHVMEHLVMGFAKEHGVDLRKDRMALQRLKDASEKAKIELSTARETQIHLPFICTPPGGGTALHLQQTLTREQLDSLTQDLADRTIALAEKVLKEADVRPSDLKDVILVGGMTRVPRIIEKAREYFGREPCKSVHPDEVVALGAAIQASALVGQESQVLLLDVTPQDLGVAIAGGYVRTLIPKNTTVPTSMTEVFNTSKDNQTTVKIMVLQGEKQLAHQNELLGEFMMTGLRQAARGEVEIEVTFDINAEGILSVSAKDRETGQSQSITVTASGGLTDDELKRIMEEQRDYMLGAKAGEEVRLQKNQLESSLRELDTLLPKVRRATEGTEFSGESLAKAEQAIAVARAALQNGDLQRLQTSGDEVSRTVELFRGVMQRLGGG